MPFDDDERTTVGLGDLHGLLVIIGVAVLGKDALVRVKGDFDDEQCALRLPRPGFDGELLSRQPAAPGQGQTRGAAICRVFFSPVVSWL